MKGYNMPTERNNEAPLDLDTQQDVDTESSPAASDDMGSHPEDLSQEDQAILDALKASGLDDDDDQEESEVEENVDDTDEQEEESEPGPETAENDEETQGEEDGSGDDVSEGDEGEAQEEDSDEDGEGKEKDQWIPYDRFQEVNRQKNKYKAEAETLSKLREAAKTAGWNEESMGQFLKWGFSFTKNPTDPGNRDVVRQLATQAGFEVIEKLPADIQSLVDSGDASPEAAQRMLQERNKAVQASEQYDVPDLSERGYTEEMGNQDANDVYNAFTERNPDLLGKPEFVEEVKEAILAEFTRLERLTGVRPLPEKWGDITRQILSSKVEEHRQPVVKPNREPLRPSGQPKRAKNHKASLEDIAAGLDKYF